MTSVPSVQRPGYRGRFAPSPTGPLHFGSLVAALGSYADARAHAGEWLVRMEDIDPPREVAGAAAGILRTLEAFGFEWDGPVLYQSTRLARYQDAIDTLERNGHTYWCACSRREIADSALARTGSGERIYPGTCAHGLPPGRTGRSIRVRVPTEPIVFSDALQGTVTQSLASEVGDFVLRRADGCFAYQIAVVVDDAAQGITDVVRGADLLDSTPRQILLQRLLGLATPRYLHLPAALNAAGEKLSKQTRAVPLDPTRACATLAAACAFLGQRPPAELAQASLRDCWAWILANWQRDRLPHARGVRTSR